MKNSPKRLLLLAVTVVALALVIAPASFAGEDDPQGPTQAGETQSAPSGPSPAQSQGPEQATQVKSESTTKRTSGGKSSSGHALHTSRTAGRTVVKTTRTADTVRAKGGVQAGFGGMATEATSVPALIAGMAGILLLIGAASILVPVRRSQH